MALHAILLYIRDYKLKLIVYLIYNKYVNKTSKVYIQSIDQFIYYLLDV